MELLSKSQRKALKKERQQLAKRGFVTLNYLGQIIIPGVSPNFKSEWQLSKTDPLCVYCGRPPKVRTVEHIIPRVIGGRNFDNLACACWDCNHKKAEQPLLAFLISIGGIK